MNYSRFRGTQVIGIGLLAFAMTGQAQDFHNNSVEIRSSTQDWTIRSSGATGNFSIENSNNVFSLDNAAKASSIYVDVDGDTSLGTITPDNDFNSRLHIEDPTPDIAFKTIAGGDIVDQTWSLFANDEAFGVCDETAYPQVGGPPTEPCASFLIQRASPVDSLVIRDYGYVGVGTVAPALNLHVSGTSSTGLLVENTDAAVAGDQVMFELRNASAAKVRFAISSDGGNIWTFDNTPSLNAFSISKVGTGANEFFLDANGNGSFRGNSFAVNHVNTSSRASKTDFDRLDEVDVLARLNALPVTQWRYKTETTGLLHVGPVAEDFHEVFGLGDGKTISTVDASGIAFAAIKGLKQQKDSEIAEKDAEIAALKAELAAQSERMMQIELMLSEFLQQQSSGIQVSSAE